MKKILLALVVVTAFSVTHANAQLQRGNVLVGGDLANFSLGLDKGSYFNITIDPKAAWFIKNNLAVGPYVNLGVLTAKGSNTETQYGVGALARYYFGTDQVNTENILRHTRVFAEGNAGLEGNNVSHGATTNGLGLGFGPGIAYFITPSIGLEALLKYDGIVGGGNDAVRNTLDFNFGFQVYLPGRSTRNKVMNDAK